MNSIKSTLDASLHPVNEISDVATLGALLAGKHIQLQWGLQTGDNISRFTLRISVQFLKHCFGQDVAREELRRSRTYHNCVATVIKEGGGAHDRTIFGKTGLANLDEATCEACLADFLGAGEVADTCELGLHNNFNEIGIFLIGETIEQRREDLKEWKAGFIIVFSQDFKTVRGFRHNVHGHIEHLRVIFEERKEDCEKNDMYFTLIGDKTPP